MRSLALSVFSLTLTVYAAGPRLDPPDAGRQQQTIENFKRFASSRLVDDATLSCTQVSFGGSSKSITIDFQGVGTHPGTAPTVDAANLIQDVFAVSSQAGFHFSHYGTIGGKMVSAYAYSYQVNGQTHDGLVYAENTGAISRITFRGAATPVHVFCPAQTR